MKRKLIFGLLLSVGFLGAMDNEEKSNILKTRKHKKTICAFALVKKFFSLFIEPVHDLVISASNPEYPELIKTLEDLNYSE